MRLRHAGRRARRKTITLTAPTSGADCAVIPNTATVDATNEPNTTQYTANNSDSASIDVLCGNVVIEKTADPAGPVSAGDDIGFDVTVTNNGDGEARGVTVDDPLPAGDRLGDRPGLADGWSINASNHLVYGPATLAAGASHHGPHRRHDRRRGLRPRREHRDGHARPTTAAAIVDRDRHRPLPRRHRRQDGRRRPVQRGRRDRLQRHDQQRRRRHRLRRLGQRPAARQRLDHRVARTAAGASSTTPSPSRATCSPAPARRSTSSAPRPPRTAAPSPTPSPSAPTTRRRRTPRTTRPTADLDVLCPDVTVTKTADEGPFNATDQIGFSVTISNEGDGTAYGAWASDPLPGTGWTIESQDGGWTLVDDTLAFAGDLLAGASSSVHVVRATTAEDCGTIDNTVTVGADNEAQEDTENNEASADLDVLCPDVTVDKDSRRQPDQRGRDGRVLHRGLERRSGHGL